MNSPLHSRLRTHLTACTATAAGAAAFTGVSGDAAASIIYSGLQNVPIFPSAVNGGVYIDVEPPFQTAQGARGFGWELNPYGSGTRMYVVPDGNSDHAAGATGTAIVTTVLNPGDVVSSLSSFTGNGFYGAGLPEGESGVIGFRFDPDSLPGAQTFYGWFRMTAGSGGNPGVVTDWAYDNTGAAITYVPEPGSIALLAMGLAGMARRRRTV